MIVRAASPADTMDAAAVLAAEAVADWLAADSPETLEGIPQMMQAVGRRYVRNFNLRQARSGTLWEGRYKSTLIQTERYLLTCMAYIDLNPVRAGLVREPGEYPWSSYAHYVGRRNDKIVSPHPLYWELGNTPFARDAAYAARVEEGVGSAEEAALNASVQGGWALGDADFVHTLQQATPRRLTRARAGRPALVNPQEP